MKHHNNVNQIAAACLLIIILQISTSHSQQHNQHNQHNIYNLRKRYNLIPNSVNSEGFQRHILLKNRESSSNHNHPSYTKSLLMPLKRTKEDLLPFETQGLEENTGEWNMAMMQYLKDMKEKGAKVSQNDAFKPLNNVQVSGSKENPVICKMEPFNICYTMDKDGKMRPMSHRRPVRLLRVY